ncbi:MAG: hypothetical protein ACREMA_04620, partial [Longimicrobiales bacterium]
MRSISVAQLACVLVPIGAAHAQDIRESRVAPITVEVDAQLVAAGAPLLIRGRTLAPDTTKPVAIKVTWLRSLHVNPAGPFPEPAHLTAPYRPDGTYAAYYSPDREGRYRAVVISPDGSACDSVEFNVATPVDVLGENVELVQKGLDISSQLVDRIVTMIREQPISPAQRDALIKLEPLQEALSQRKSGVDQMRAALEGYGSLATSDARVAAAFAPAYRQLNAWHRDAAQHLPGLEQALAESRKANVLCNQLIIVEQGFKLLETMFTLAGGFTSIVGFFREKSPPTAALSMFAKGKMIAGSFIINSIPGKAAAASAFVTHLLFDQYCERFEGPVLGKMTAEYYHNGEMWWRYTTNIEGKMTLAYRKGSDASKG